MHRRAESGSVLMLVAVFFAIVASVIAIYQIGNLSSTRTSRQLNVVAQADNAARSGITDATAWFRRQLNQPVGKPPPAISDAEFFPREATCDTMDESVGLLKEFPLTGSQAGQQGGLWAHYELVRVGNLRGQSTDLVHDTSWEVNPNISQNTGYGRVWTLVSTGYVFKRNDMRRVVGDQSGQRFIAAYNQPPNQVLAKSRIQTNLYRVNLNMSGETAVHLDDLSQLVLTNSASINSPTQLAVLYRQAGTPSISTNSKIFGSINRRGGVPANWLDAVTVFGSGPSQLKQMADLVINAPASPPAALPKLAFIYCDGNVTFDATHPLVGSGFLIVNGNLTVNAGSNTQFTGVIHVSGSTVIHGTGTDQITGALIAKGGLTLDAAQVRLDMAIVPSMRNQLLQYRAMRSSAVTDTNEKSLLGL